MKERIFYFHGRAGDLPLALLRHTNESLAAQNRKNAALLKGPLHTIQNLVSAAKINIDGPENPRRFNRSRAIRNIITRGY